MKKNIVAFLISLLVLMSSSFAAELDPVLVKKLKVSTSSEKISAIVYLKEKPVVSLMSKDRVRRLSEVQAFSKRSQQKIMKLLEAGKSKGRVSKLKSFWTFNGFAIEADRSVIEEISSREDVERIELNKTLKLPPAPRITAGDRSVVIKASTIESNISQIRADKAWFDYGIYGQGVKVGIADTGCLAAHPDLADRIFLQADFDSVGNKISNTASDGNGHGTHVAGIVAGGSASGKAIGVAPKASLLIAKVFTDSGDATYAQVFGGVEWLIANDSKVINLSLGSDSVGEAEDVWRSKVDAWDSLGVLIVAAIGNDGPLASTTTSPGNVLSAFGVGAVNGADSIASFSSRGPIVWSGTSYKKPDICAPGVIITSSYNNGAYTEMSGTSMACPHISGIAALMLEANPTLETTSIKDILKNTASRQDLISYQSNDYGWGRADALGAVISSLAGDTTPPTIEAPSISGSTYGQNITVSSVITDNLTISPTAFLYYKNQTGVWESVVMTRESGTNSFNGIIDASKVKSSIDYYLTAGDHAGNSSRLPADAPAGYYTINIAPLDVLAISENQTCPNPFAAGRESSTFFYNLSKPANVTVRIFNMAGEAVKTILQSGNFGYNTFNWDGTSQDGQIVPNGVYIYQILAVDTSGASGFAKGKIIVLK